MTSDSTRTIVVIGAGISGLTVAYRLQKIARRANWNLSVKVLESTHRSGGLIQSKSLDGTVIETGPEAFMTRKVAALRLAEELELKEDLVHSGADLRTRVLWHNRLHELPDGFIQFAPGKVRSFVETSLLSLGGKARICCDLFIPPAKQTTDESLAEFLRRRFGREILERVAEPLIGGIYAGDPRCLSAESTLPMLHQLEVQYGSVIRGMLFRSARENPSAETAKKGLDSISFLNGLQQLTDALEKKLEPGSIIFGCQANKITPGYWKQWRVICTNSRTFEADEVVLAAPAPVAGSIISHTDNQIGSRLQQILYSRTVILNAIFHKNDIDVVKTDSGFVVPEKENEWLRACSFSTNKFAKPVAPELTALRLFARGTNTEFLKQSDDDITNTLLEQARGSLRFSKAPRATALTRHERAIPQYRVGHRDKIDEIGRLLHRLPGISLVGNAYTGVGIADCVERAENVAALVAERASLLQPRQIFVCLD